MTSAISEFERSLRDHGVGWIRVPPSAFTDALADAVREPAVGARLPFESVSLDGTGVTLDPSPAELDALMEREPIHPVELIAP